MPPIPPPAADETFVWPHAQANAGRLLDGVKVLDLSRVLAGPYSAMVLADLGADVIKVEGPNGDETRRWGPPFHLGTAAYYFGTNRNKWGIVLDLADEDDHRVLEKLLREADVVIHNFTESIARKLRVDCDAVWAVNPMAVHLTLSGFGPEDPDRRGYDLIAQALSGMMAITGEPGRPAAKVGVPISDLAAGLFGALGVVSALVSRPARGAGTRLDVSLYDATLAFLANQSMNWLLAGEDTPRMGSEHPNITPYGAYEAADGAIVLGVGTDLQFRGLCTVLGAPRLADDERFATNVARVAHRDALRVELERLLAARSCREWAALLDAHGVPNAEVRSVGEALQAPETRSLTSIEHRTLGDIRQVMGPIRVDGAYQEPYLPPPTLGEHDDQVVGRG